MYESFARLAALTVLAIATTPAAAATLTASGTLGLKIGALPTVTIAGGPASVFVSSGAGDFVEPANLFGPTSVSLPYELFTGVPLISSLRVTGLANDTMAVAGGSAAAALEGLVILGATGGLVNLLIPLAPVGGGGVIQAGAAALMITVTGHIWTTGVGQVTALTSATPLGGFTNTVSLSGTDNRTAGHQGAILLVSPFRTISNATGTLTGFATQLLTFVPEPGVLLLIGSVAAGLVLGGHRRM